MGGGRIAVKKMLHVLVDHAVIGQQPGEILQLLPGRQLAVNQQIAGFHEGGILRQFLDGNAPISQDALFAVQKGDSACSGAGVDIAVIKRDIAGFRPQFGDINGFFIFAAGDNGKFVFIAVDNQFYLVAHIYKPRSGLNKAVVVR